MTHTLSPGVFKIKNVSGGPYTVEEIDDYVLADNDEIDLCDPGLPGFYYTDWDSIQRMRKMSSSKLCQDIEAGDIQIVEEKPPSLPLIEEQI